MKHERAKEKTFEQKSEIVARMKTRFLKLKKLSIDFAIGYNFEKERSVVRSRKSWGRAVHEKEPNTRIDSSSK